MYTSVAFMLNSPSNLSLTHNAWPALRSRETYNALTNWLTDARTLASPNIVIVLVGNKKDLEADREVTFMEASRFAQENGKSGIWKASMSFIELTVLGPVICVQSFSSACVICI